MTVNDSMNLDGLEIKTVIPKPSVDEVLKAQKEWEDLDEGKYRIQEDVLKKIFEKFPTNKRLEDVLLKAATLNDFYSTNIFSIFGVAKHIVSISNIDELLVKGDIELVMKLRETTFVNKNGDVKKKDFYSFATKYCSHHQPTLYPIYDGYVDKVLRYFRNKDKFDDFRNDYLKDYGKFKSIISEFQKKYKLEEFSFKELDRYLWQIGKRYFPSNQKIEL